MRVVDSHTEGEPTRVIVEGGPALGSGPLGERAARLAADFEDFYTSVVVEPRGREALVGALLVEPTHPDAVAGVIYFDAAAVLGMCGHGTIGLAVTLAHLDRIGTGSHTIETPVGLVEIELHDANTVTVTNVESYRLAKNVSVPVDGFGMLSGDIAWGGNWFFIVDDCPLALEATQIRRLEDLALETANALRQSGICGRDGAVIDHVIFNGPASSSEADARNFVLCPDGAFDRSPCGTGTSAILASRAADGLIAPGQTWVQESIIGSRYRATYLPAAGARIIPKITGRAFVTAETTLLFDRNDPYAGGIRHFSDVHTTS